MRLLVFVVGGVTYSEIRAAYEVASQFPSHDIFIGMTSTYILCSTSHMTSPLVQLVVHYQSHDIPIGTTCSALPSHMTFATPHDDLSRITGHAGGHALQIHLN